MATQMRRQQERAETAAKRRDFQAGEDISRINGYEPEHDFSIREPEVLSPFTGAEARERKQIALSGIKKNNQAAGDQQQETALRQSEAPERPVMTSQRISFRRHIGTKEINSAMATLIKYQSERKALTERIRENQIYYEFTNTGKLRANIAVQFSKSYSGYMFNSVANKHADFMDNMPSPAILPREEDDQETAQILSDVIPCILDQNDFEKEYSDECYDKIITGTGVYGVFWDPSGEGGLGSIRVKTLDIMNAFWQAGVSDIQDSPNFFYVSVMDNEKLKLLYPDLKEHFEGSAFFENKYEYEDQVDMTDKSLVVDWYYKKFVRQEGPTGQMTVKKVLHYCKFCNGAVLYSSEDDEEYANGYYDHGLYPFIFDVMFPLKGSPAGFGYVDVMKNPQEYIDKLDGLILENARINANPRWLIPEGAGINERDFMDQSKKVIRYSGQIDNIKPLDAPNLPTVCLETRNQKIDELKETSGNRDFSQGSTTSGVTAASAIAALQEAGSKLSRDMIKLSYNSYAKICRFMIEYIRQFYDIDRIYRITGKDKSYRFQAINSAMLNTPPVDEFGQKIAGRRIDFDIKVSAQRSSPFSRLSQNELAKELYSAGIFNPQFADQALMMLSMMDFEGRDEIIQKVSEQSTIYKENAQLKTQLAQMAMAMASMSGDPANMGKAQMIAQRYGIQQDGGAVVPQSSYMGGATAPSNTTDSRVDNAREATRERSAVR